MRNTPLWRPQPNIDAENAEPVIEPSNGIQRVSAVALAGLGLTLALGVGAVGYLTYFDANPSTSPPALQAAATEPPPAVVPPAKPLASAEPRVSSTGARLPDARQPPPVEVIDVAVAQSEGDVAKLEEITGMVEPAPVTQPSERVTAVVNPTVPPEAAASATSELRPVIDASAVVVQPDVEADSPEEAASGQNAETDEATQTASIRPDPPVNANPPEEEPAAADAGVPLPALSAVKVNRYVNMRASAADEARVITVVPAGATVQAQKNCGWCVVTYNGQRGYIYKSFLQGGNTTAAANVRKAPAAKTPAAEAPSAKPGLY